MVAPLSSPTKLDVIYPERDGKPMSDNTKQFRWIVTIQGGLDALFQDDPNVLVVGDLLWYPVEGNNKICTAPDGMVIFGRPKGDRSSYLQWKEDNIPPQVVFEILSPGNTLTEMAKKLAFYDRYGVEEYYLYDPDKVDLSGWLRNQGKLEVIDSISDWVSPRLGIRFDMSGTQLQIYRPDGKPFATYLELAQGKQEAESRAEQAEALLAQERQQMQALLAKLQEKGIELE
ncbi:MAG: Uma2 family endonuclease [Moorea sp. SIO3I7]|uniref:Uma2 family endonuclease n=1 Tax=unclassified Moorena TaxID=2683338 RepID=UPI0013C22140|nr:MULTISPECIES: Uma2 family endonuclease [unclassified Moorena]NEN96619.1 Uma2 family endonuclease [Moorena sp. SIO3I7]NEO09348.1 Uma2 family endonuclease [Moorena sp. SIO3I8]NEO20580.1 Uma2 family endonuclease [Moorena sp. SIO4A5]NEP26226.1 Uma2 family endonuclease [Moorena sp. SIO3I6]NEQ58552.1 Uma2 family endonuclease [Moorena sp. SIO4A1]